MVREATGNVRAHYSGHVDHAPLIPSPGTPGEGEGEGLCTSDTVRGTNPHPDGGAFGVDSRNAAKSTSSGHGADHRGGAGSKGAGAKGAGGNATVKNGGTHVSTLHSGTSSGGGAASSHSTSSQGSSTSTGNTGTSNPSPTHKPTAHPQQSSAPSSLVTPATGVYTLAVTGSENAKFGPISACHNQFPSRATLDVHHASGESASAYDFDMRLYPNQANKHDERHIYKYSKSSMDLTFEQETITCSGIKQASTVDYSPAQTRVQLPLTVGASWHNHGGGSSRTETGNSTVAKHATMRVGDHSYAVYEIVTKLAMTGSETGERDQTWWYAPALGIPLKFSETLHGKRSGASYSESYTASVVNLP